MFGVVIHCMFDFELEAAALAVSRSAPAGAAKATKSPGSRRPARSRGCRDRGAGRTAAAARPPSGTKVTSVRMKGLTLAAFIASPSRPCRATTSAPRRPPPSRRKSECCRTACGAAHRETFARASALSLTVPSISAGVNAAPQHVRGAINQRLDEQPRRRFRPRNTCSGRRVEPAKRSGDLLRQVAPLVVQQPGQAEAERRPPAPRRRSVSTPSSCLLRLARRSRRALPAHASLVLEHRRQEVLEVIAAAKRFRHADPSADDREHRQDHQRNQHHPRTFVDVPCHGVP